MDKLIEKLNQQIDALALTTVMLDSEDIPGLGEILKSIESTEDMAGELKDELLISILKAMKGYVEELILGEKSDLEPFAAGVSRLQEMCRNLRNGEDFDRNISSLLISLGHEETNSNIISKGSKTDPDKQADKELQDNETNSMAGQDYYNEGKEAAGMIGEEDKEIIIDFVTESLENLGAIEIKSMDLEQDPSDLDAINAIFRPFHTIKGVSGFLNFNKINKLSHTVENLLDKARDGELCVDGEIIDIILNGVDILKKMIEEVRASLDAGTPSEGGIEIGGIVGKVEDILRRSEGIGERHLGEILIEKGVVSEQDLEESLELQKKDPDKKIGEILVERKKVETKEVVSALREQKKFSKSVSLQIKVDTGKLDNVVDMVGELAIAQSMLRQNEQIIGMRDRKLYQIINQLNQITSGLQRTGMSLRMVPIMNTFQKMLRLVRDLAKKAGKEVQLVMSGEDTEIDRNMVEEIYEPMVHMIRNSIDHGLEKPEERESAGKPRQGTIYLRAYHRGGDIVIEIEDDGRGLNREKILEKAKSSGLIAKEERLTDAEINNLIFHPGLSTAEKISDISGRGVGMDVVRNKIKKLRGRVEVQSLTGKGATVIIRLPLTLAIVDGMIVKVASERYIIPTLSVQESFRPKKSECHTVKKKGEMIMVRNNLIPLIRLDRLLGRNGNSSSHSIDCYPWEKLVVIVENQEKRRCLLIDELLGQEEVVIKSIGGGLKTVKGIAGGAILGDGRVGLILDIAGIFQIAAEES
ncbi:MAG TPA: chemotaxis protein CheA [Desulfatiglandales bacterium]|nr:chemotaxis protein CheA [Desulfatiglandales bacterium]